MDRVMAATVFNHICDLGSLSAAARALGLSRPMVSRYLDEMEKWAGARLIHRSSRRLTITPAGEEALVKTRSLAQLSLDIAAASAAQIPSGTLRVACAHYTAMHILAPVLPTFLARYPQLRIEVEINNQPVSLVALRIPPSLGPSPVDWGTVNPCCVRLSIICINMALLKRSTILRSITASITVALPENPGTFSMYKGRRFLLRSKGI